jgi:hypothetical protein
METPGGIARIVIPAVPARMVIAGAVNNAVVVDVSVGIAGRIANINDIIRFAVNAYKRNVVDR